MTADPALGHLTPLRGALHFGARSLGGPLPLSRRRGIRHTAKDVTTHERRRHSGVAAESSFQDVDPLSYPTDASEEHAAPCDLPDSQEAVHDMTILELSGDSTDDHWALTPEEIDELTSESTLGTD